MSTKRVLYDSESVLVTSDLRDTPAVVVTFSNVDRAKGQLVAFGDGFVQKEGFSGIFVTARHNHWWQIADREELCAAVRIAGARYTDRIGHGVSMGGFGALLLGYSMGCTRLLTIAPQTVISDPNLLKAGWNEAIAQWPITAGDAADTLGDLIPEILFDPHERIDGHQVAHLQARRAIIRIELPFAGHKVLAALREGLISRTIVAGLLKQAISTQEVQAEYYRAQHRSAEVIRNIALFEADNGRIEAARCSTELLRPLVSQEAYEKVSGYVDRRANRRSIKIG